MNTKPYVIVCLGMLMCLAFLLGCENHVSSENKASDDSLALVRDVVEDCTTEVYKPQIWIDNYLSDDEKDTIIVRLWSRAQGSYLDSLPIDTTEDWPSWYQRNEVEAVLFLKDIEPLYLESSFSIYYCAVLCEQGKRAIAIVPGVAQWSNCNVCKVYTITNNRWVQIREFSVLSSFTFIEEGEEPEISREWLVKKDGRWMYRDYYTSVLEGDAPFCYVFDNE